MRQISDVLEKRLGGQREGAIDVEARTATFVFSTNSPDRMGDIIDQKTWQLDRYKANPQFLWAHKSRELPIGKTIDLQVKGNRLIGTVKFADEDQNEFADQCWELVKGGYLNAVSVGFRPHKYESYSDDKTGACGYKFFDCELLECSLVPIPCNQDALIGTKDLAGAVAPAFKALLDGYQDNDAPVFAREEIEAVVKAFGGTSEQPESKIARDTSDGNVYDESGELMGVMVGNVLKMHRTYQDTLRARNAVAISEQASAVKSTEATTEEKTVPRVGPNFFLKSVARRSLARRTLLGT